MIQGVVLLCVLQNLKNHYLGGFKMAISKIENCSDLLSLVTYVTN